ncbi:MAG: XRE family transcriptional regulator [Aquisalimonadaceae bacterium]
MVKEDSAAPSEASVHSLPGQSRGQAGVDLDLGRRLRTIRKSQRLTLDVLAEKTGFTKGYLSKIERGHKVPPIASLINISHALGTDISDLLQQAKDGDALGDVRISIVRSNERQVELRGGSSFGYDYQALAHKMKPKHMEPFLFTFPAQMLQEVYFEHEGEEMIFVLSGKVEFEAGGERTTLYPGDCIYFDSSLPHRGCGVNGEAKALVVLYSAESR